MEENQGQANTQDQGNTSNQMETFTTEQQKVVSELLESKIAEASNSITKQFKDQLAGLNRRNSELETYLEEQKKAAMGEKEKLEYELNQREALITAKEQDFLKMSNKAEAQKYASENNIPLELLETINYSDKDSVMKNLETFKSIVDAERNKSIEEFKTANGHKPVGGGSAKKAMYTGDDLKSMPLDEVSRLVDEGRVKLD